MSTKPRILAQTSLLVIFSLCFSFEFSRKLDKRLVANILWFAVWKPFFPSRPLFLYLARTTTGPEHIHRRSRYSPFLGDQLTPATGLVAAQQSYQSNIEVAGSTLGALYRHDTLAVHGGKRCQNLREVWAHRLTRPLPEVFGGPGSLSNSNIVRERKRWVKDKTSSVLLMTRRNMDRRDKTRVGTRLKAMREEKPWMLGTWRAFVVIDVGAIPISTSGL